MICTGAKVKLSHRPEWGYGEVRRVSADAVTVAFALGLNSWQIETSSPDQVVHSPLPTESRCFVVSESGVKCGRVLSVRSEHGSLRTYFVRWGGAHTPMELREDTFCVRSYLPFDDARVLLSSLNLETPFFFEARKALLSQILVQNKLAGGLPGVASAKIQMLPHQIEIATRVLHDPTRRYLLADEVGLGKTIEAGIILRQLVLDAPRLRAVVFSPAALVRQWQEELRSRFDLTSIEVLPHEALVTWTPDEQPCDIVVIDEAHRLTGSGTEFEAKIANGLRYVSRCTPDLLLLSATPVLHKDEELLTLLSLLDPNSYGTSSIDRFRERTAIRMGLGRALLALRSATSPAFIRLNAKKIAEMLPQDETVRLLTEQLGTASADANGIRDQLHFHVSETYRIHRRMLRTRRRWLVESQPEFVRNVRESVEYEIEEDSYGALWQALENWRTIAAARVGDSPVELHNCALAYASLAQAISGEPDKLTAIADQVAIDTSATAREAAALKEFKTQLGKELLADRAVLIKDILVRQFKTNVDGPSAKYVVFCSSSDSIIAIANEVRRALGSDNVRTAGRNTSADQAARIFAEFAQDRSRVLITDATGEEGFNLQFAKGIVFQDIPWSPMRIEQRLGRLDRVNHQGRINCFIIVTGENDSLNVDECWRRLISEALKIFSESVSDLQHLIDQEMPHLRKQVFLRGPLGLLDEIEPLAGRVAFERGAIAEQDVIDGMHNFATGSKACGNLTTADGEAPQLQKALSLYLDANVGLRTRLNEDTCSITFTLPPHFDPIIPSDKLKCFDGVLNHPSTTDRKTVLKNPKLKFLRPGHKAVDGCSDLLMWDDRARAFALWRPSPGRTALLTVFRCTLYVDADWTDMRTRLNLLQWSAAKQASLMRLLRAWFPPTVHEVFSTPDGDSPTPEIVSQCRRPYDKRFDTNLGKERTQHIRDAIGEETWAAWCNAATETAVEQVKRNAEYEQNQKAALHAATAHFAMLRAQISSRKAVGLESSERCAEALASMGELAAASRIILEKPKISLDSVGAYFLSERPFWGTNA